MGRGVTIVLVVCVFLLGHLNAQAPAEAEAPLAANGNKTTTSTSTTTEATTTTTPKPTTTTTSAPAPPKPTPKPDGPFPNNKINASVVEGKTICIRLMGAFELLVPYQKSIKDKNTTELVNATVPVPTYSVVSGECGISKNATTQTVTFTWECAGNETHDPNNLTFTFEENKNTSVAIHDISAQKWALVKISGSVSIDTKLFPDAVSHDSIDFEINHLAMYQANLGHSYKCTALETLKGKDAKNGVAVKVQSLQVEAFRTNEDVKFSSAQECSMDAVTDIVPIAVGASLAGLVVIVLIAYLLGRRRSRARGYQSV